MATPRSRGPELEHDVGRTPSLGYEPAGSYGSVRYLEHGFPNPLVRWHYHEEYELHLIVATRGKVFVGDYIGQFEPGHLVLTGPRLPHNWISTDVPEPGVALRDMVLQFGDAPLRQAARYGAELAEALPLLANDGAVLLLGYYDELRLPYMPLFLKQARLQTAREWAPGDLPRCRDMLADGSLDVSGMITHRAASGQVARAYRIALEEPECLKLVLEW